MYYNTPSITKPWPEHIKGIWLIVTQNENTISKLQMQLLKNYAEMNLWGFVITSKLSSNLFILKLSIEGKKKWTQAKSSTDWN